MKIGIIIIFHNNEAELDKTVFIEQINSSKTIELCLVDNDSKDNTLDLLKEIKESCPSQVSVIEIKKKASEDVAKRAGARYMFNQFNLKHIGFINTNTINKNDNQLNLLIETFYTHKDCIIDFNLKVIEKQQVKQTLYKSVFSVVEYLNKINTSTNFNNLNPSV